MHQWPNQLHHRKNTAEREMNRGTEKIGDSSSRSAVVDEKIDETGGTEDRVTSDTVGERHKSRYRIEQRPAAIRELVERRRKGSKEERRNRWKDGKGGWGRMLCSSRYTSPRPRRCIASFTSQPLFYPFFFLLLSLFLRILVRCSCRCRLQCARVCSWKNGEEISVAKWQASRLEFSA